MSIQIKGRHPNPEKGVVIPQTKESSVKLLADARGAVRDGINK